MEQVAIDRRVVLADEAVARLRLSRPDLFQEHPVRLGPALICWQPGASAIFHLPPPWLNGGTAWRLPYRPLSLKRR
jgi:hypothetical protein